MTLDFDAEQSIRSSIVTGFQLQAVAWIAAGSDTIRTRADWNSGNFKSMAVPEGKYDLRVEATIGVFEPVTIADDTVVCRQGMSVGVVSLVSP